jgi:hypothetical protein
LLAWGYTADRLRNLDFDVIGAADSLTGDVMLMDMLLVIVVVVIVVVVVVAAFVLLSAWIGGGWV